ncbi:MAG: iron-sulfur cluster insertion protein ErpA [Bacteroidota bacterium]|jgi:iron-sulfur cluster assembly protein|nr:iron-sulfur cluster insertion protein ErpA [Bacteroidota bacterium]
MSEQMTEAVSQITVTDKAAKEIATIRTDNDIPENYLLRIGVKGGGCSGLSYSLGFDGDVRESDERLEVNGVRLVIDAKSLFYLGGTELDYSDGLSGRGFVFNNPNAVRTCGCGSSFSS